jgi:hypothetical protein
MRQNAILCRGSASWRSWNRMCWRYSLGPWPVLLTRDTAAVEVASHRASNSANRRYGVFIVSSLDEDLSPSVKKTQLIVWIFPNTDIWSYQTILLTAVRHVPGRGAKFCIGGAVSAIAKKVEAILVASFTTPSSPRKDVAIILDEFKRREDWEY